VIGIGDMSGDVFGNGMLLFTPHQTPRRFSDQRHVFLDPNPDPGASFRNASGCSTSRRIFVADYDSKLISKGGAFTRACEIGPPYPEAREFGVDDNSLTRPT